MTRLEPPLFCAAFTHTFHSEAQAQSTVENFIILYRRTRCCRFCEKKKRVFLMSGASEQAMAKAMVEQKYFIYFFRQCKKE
jgi:hypothetical protein